MQCPVDGCDFESSKNGVHSHCGKIHSVEQNPHKIKCQCNNCGDEFIIPKSTYENGQGKYCSMECRSEDGTVECECNYCGDKFTIQKYKYRKGSLTGKHCSMECLSENATVECQCNNCGDKFTIPKSNYENGQGKYCSYKCMGLDKRSSNTDIRDSPEYRQFRETVLERDNHRCVECGDDGDLHVHHVVPIYDDESLATDVGNGKTLCVECHAEAHEELGDPQLAALIRSDGTEFDIDVSV
jgi:hypothetical protein